MIPEIITNKIAERYPEDKSIEGRKLALSHVTALDLAHSQQDAAQFGFELADAVGFAEWIMRLSYESGNDGKYWIWSDDHNEPVERAINELYELYLKTKG